MRAMATTATGRPALMRSAWRMAAPGIFSPLEAMSTAAVWVGCLSNFRRPNFLRIGEPEARRTRGWRRHRHSSVSACIVDRLGTASGVTTVGPGVSPRSMPPGEPRTSGMASEVSIPRRLSLSLRHQ